MRSIVIVVPDEGAPAKHTSYIHHVLQQLDEGYTSGHHDVEHHWTVEDVDQEGLGAALKAYDTWASDRAQLSARDTDPEYQPTANEWADSDDTAAELAHQLAAALKEVLA